MIVDFEFRKDGTALRKTEGVVCDDGHARANGMGMSH